MPQRRTSQRAPPGFYDEQGLFMQQAQQVHGAQRRTYNEPPQQLPPGGRRMSGHPGLPQMQIPNHQQHYPPTVLQQPPPPPQDFMQSPGMQQGPPPGFNPHMPRHPPGIHNIPNIFQPPQQPPMQSQQAGRETMSFGGLPGGQGGMQSPPIAPPGFYGGPQSLPPGFMQMRSPGEAMPVGAAPNMRGGRPFDGGFDVGAGMGGPGPRR